MKTLFTIGHSTRTQEEFFEILQCFEIDYLVDVRTIPKSRHNPWFNSETLKAACKQHGISYLWLLELGGLRRAKPDSINMGWHNTSFRGYADYMQTPAFFAGLKRLNEIVKSHHVAIMCAEALPWRCHRSLIADAELIRGISVYNIMNKKTAQAHKLTSFAQVIPHTRPKKIYYPANDA